MSCMNRLVFKMLQHNTSMHPSQDRCMPRNRHMAAQLALSSNVASGRPLLATADVTTSANQLLQVVHVFHGVYLGTTELHTRPLTH